MVQNRNDQQGAVMRDKQVDVAGTGFVVLDRIYVDGQPPVEALGGSCGNILLSLAMLSRNVAPVLSLGDDDVGRSMVAEFATAGASIQYIIRRRHVASPVLAQLLDTTSGQHSFSFICPDTDEEFPRHRPIEASQVTSAARAITSCRIFYTDRLSEAIVEAMECASAAGALVYFEPSAIHDREMFCRALAATTILKYSSDRLDGLLPDEGGDDRISIVTHGVEGLEVRHGEGRYFCKSVTAPRVRDTCGSGDMLSVGIIDGLVSNGMIQGCLNVDGVLAGVRAGQRLAAANCAFTGARGLFLRRGAEFARSILDDRVSSDWFAQLELFPDL
jgi:fructokinase